MVHLPPSVELALQFLPPFDAEARAHLARLGEEASLHLLQILGNRSESLFTQESVSYTSSSAPPPPPPQDDDVLELESSSLFSEAPQRVGEGNRIVPASLSPSPVLLCLDKLEFRKAFLILSYCGRNKVEDVITMESIQNLKDKPMALFESELWSILGHKCIDQGDRQKKLDWDSGRTYLYRCHVDPDGTCFFKGPYLHKQNTHLQRVLGDENVLHVRFTEEVADRNTSGICSKLSNGRYENIAKDGIMVGLRRYHYFVFKDGGKEEKKKCPTSSPVKCYFVCFESTACLNMSIQEGRWFFMHMHTVSSLAKYMVRFSLILSKTVKLEVDLPSVNIITIEDEPCQDQDGRTIFNEDGEAMIHTDGTGFISENLALKCPLNIVGGNCLVQGEMERKSSDLTKSMFRILELPLLIQFRMFYNGMAVKGTVLLNKQLPDNTIQIRPSMIKVDRDPKLQDFPSANSFEIVSTSNRPRKVSYLSKYLIALLNYGGVPGDYFMDLLMNALKDAQNAYSNKRAALAVSSKYGEMDNFIVPRMIGAGIPLDEPYLYSRLSVLRREERKGLKGGKLPINECYYLMGTTDPTGILNTDEVCVILEDGQISGKVLVYKHPGLHFGDIHVLTAKYVEELGKFVGDAKYAIFFPTKGPRSLADEIANSDFDGDMYWVSRNPQLLEYYKPSAPWMRTYLMKMKSASQRKPIEYSDQEREDELWQQFITTRFHPSNNIGCAADSWLSYMDRILTLGDDCAKEKDCVKKKMLQLVDIYYDALDAPKTGKKVDIPKELKPDKFPHFMERPNSYLSKSVLGQIFDTVDSYLTEQEQPKEVWQLPCLSVQVPERFIKLWKDHYDQYREEMTNAMNLEGKLKDDAADEVLEKYKQILYGAKEFEYSTRNHEDLFNEALAIYQITYDYAKKFGVGKCSFAWKVAGRALCMLYSTKQDSDIIPFLKSVLKEIA